MTRKRVGPLLTSLAACLLTVGAARAQEFEPANYETVEVMQAFDPIAQKTVEVLIKHTYIERVENGDEEPQYCDESLADPPRTASYELARMTIDSEHPLTANTLHDMYDQLVAETDHPMTRGEFERTSRAHLTESIVDTLKFDNPTIETILANIAAVHDRPFSSVQKQLTWLQAQAAQELQVIPSLVKIPKNCRFQYAEATLALEEKFSLTPKTSTLASSILYDLATQTLLEAYNDQASGTVDKILQIDNLLSAFGARDDERQSKTVRYALTLMDEAISMQNQQKFSTIAGLAARIADFGKYTENTKHFGNIVSTKYDAIVSGINNLDINAKEYFSNPERLSAAMNELWIMTSTDEGPLVYR